MKASRWAMAVFVLAGPGLGAAYGQNVQVGFFKRNPDPCPGGRSGSSWMMKTIAAPVRRSIHERCEGYSRRCALRTPLERTIVRTWGPVTK